MLLCLLLVSSSFFYGRFRALNQVAGGH
jgi:hypothetical protein